ncbi:unnamed protein product [Brugia pahangi]|uniref:Transposase n=1 Tax=Brugia pahangi TaxID=6280 RepID=A0A0N4T0E8_BRUPA|nr:unnamed protein product [Brugia pahangi]
MNSTQYLLCLIHFIRVVQTRFAQHRTGLVKAAAEETDNNKKSKLVAILFDNLSAHVVSVVALFNFVKLVLHRRAEFYPGRKQKQDQMENGNADARFPDSQIPLQSFSI